MDLYSLIKTAFYKAGYSIKRIRHPPRASSRTRNREEIGPPDMMQLLHKVNPYEGFDFHSLPFDAHGWGGQSPAFRELISQVKPRLIVEVGTWKGASALKMGGYSRPWSLYPDRMH